MSQLERMSPIFRDSLRAMADAKTAAVEPSPKEASIQDAKDVINKFHERIITDWLFALDDESRNQVIRLFQELNQLSAAEFLSMMKRGGACCPWKLIGSMFSDQPEETSNVEQNSNNEEVLIIEERPAK